MDEGGKGNFSRRERRGWEVCVALVTSWLLCRWLNGQDAHSTLGGEFEA